MLEEFKKFVMRGNVVDMAVGIIVGAAFGSIVGSIVSDIIMPPVGLLLGGADFSNFFAVLKQGTQQAGPYVSLAEAQKAGAVTINYGMFINKIISFLIVSFSVFLLVKSINKLQPKKEEPAPQPATKDCPYCFSAINIKATRCQCCTSEISAS